MNFKLRILTVRKVCQESTEMKLIRYWISLESKILTAHPRGSIFGITAEYTMQCFNSNMKDRSFLINNPFSAEGWCHAYKGVRESALSRGDLIVKKMLSVQIRWVGDRFDLT